MEKESRGAFVSFNDFSLPVFIAIVLYFIFKILQASQIGKKIKLHKVNFFSAIIAIIFIMMIGSEVITSHKFQGFLKNYIFTVSAKETILLEGVLTPKGNEIRNKSGDVIISVPAGVLKKATLITHSFEIKNNSIRLRFRTRPTLDLNELSQIHIVRPDNSILLSNYLGKE